RSPDEQVAGNRDRPDGNGRGAGVWRRCGAVCPGVQVLSGTAGHQGKPHRIGAIPRSEEHTSELQSRGHLVCRLLLEKKKKQYDVYYFQKTVGKLAFKHEVVLVYHGSYVFH